MELTTIRSTRDYLEAMVDFARNNRGTETHYYRCLEHIVLEEGKEYEFAKKPKGIKYGPWKHCFSNSCSLASSNPGRFGYVEGFATNIIPTYHAWNVDKETGFLVDTTWRKDKGPSGIERQPHDYIGIEIPVNVYEEFIFKSQRHGALDVWELNWLMLKRKLPDFTDIHAVYPWLLNVLGTEGRL